MYPHAKSFLLQRNDFALPYVNPSHNRGCEGECIGVRYFYAARACAARGYVIGRGVYTYIYKSALFLEPIFYYLLLEVHFNTDRLLIEFNGLWYSLPARQVFVAITNPDSLSFG